MGIVREILSKSVDFAREEIMPLRGDLIKAGILKPDKTAYDAKASLIDPWSQHSTVHGYKEKWSILDYSKCRQITYADPIVASIIQTRLNQVAAFAYPQCDKYKVGFKIKMRDQDGSPGKGTKGRIDELEKFMTHCGVPENFEDTPELKRRDGLETFLRKITRDSLTFDQINFEITPRNNGIPYGFFAVDAGTIRLIADKKEKLEQYGGYDKMGYDQTNIMPYPGVYQEFKLFQPKSPKYAQIVNGVIRHVFDEWEMAFGVRNPRTDILANGYGFSEIEMLVTAITAHMNAETYNRKFFSQGSSIKGVLAFEGSVPPDQLEAFRRQWYQQVSGINNAWRTPILSLGKDSKMNWQSLHSTNREMEFGKWLEYCIKTICGVFQMDPIEIGFDITKQTSGQSGGSGGLGHGNQAERLMFSQDKGLRPLLRHIQSLLNEYIIFRIDPNFEFEFVGLNSGNEKDDLDKAVQQVKTFKTINEIRAEHDLPDLKDPEDMKALNLGDVILDPQFVQLLQSKVQSGEQDQMGGMPGQPGAPGQDGEPEEEPDYENMSEEELQAELAKLEGEKKQQMSKQPGQPGGFPPKKGGFPPKKGSSPKKGELKQPEATEKSMFKELIL